MGWSSEPSPSRRCPLPRNPSASRVAERFLDAAASDWTKPQFDDPGASTAVITYYKPAQDEDDDGEGYYVIWHGDPSGPDPKERDPFLAIPVQEDLPTLAAARAAVERAFKKKHGRRAGVVPTTSGMRGRGGRTATMEFRFFRYKGVPSESEWLAEHVFEDRGILQNRPARPIALYLLPLVPDSLWTRMGRWDLADNWEEVPANQTPSQVRHLALSRVEEAAGNLLP